MRAVIRSVADWTAFSNRTSSPSLALSHTAPVASSVSSSDAARTNQDVDGSRIRSGM
jgi:hypothetical protein